MCSLLVAPGVLACTGQLGTVDEGADKRLDPTSEGEERTGDATDPGFKGIHRLNNREYDNTIRDLLGSDPIPEKALNETSDGFDNVASSLGMTLEQYTAFYTAAETAASDVFSNQALKARVLICDQGVADPVCAEEIIKSFGLQAFRRPLAEEEVANFLGVYQRAVALELTHSEAVEQVLIAFLASPQFLYRMEFDEDPTSTKSHSLSQYELASRLSYFLWSTMPDSELLGMAAAGSLEGAELERIVEQMIADPRSDSLVDAFAWQWLGMKGLEEHGVLRDVYPEWNEALRDSMLAEARIYAARFIRGEANWGEFLTGDASFAQVELAPFYGGNPEGRMGFLGLGAILTTSSFADRTSPTIRAMWILENLLCDPPLPPPAGIPELMGEVDPDSQNKAALIENVRERLELHRSDPSCSGCHSIMDPFGMALENYDAIGRYRDTYSNGDAVDPSSALPDGRTFDSLVTLASGVNQDERFIDCTIEKAFIYSMGRSMTKNDHVHVDSVREKWGGADATFTDLVRQLIQSVPFTERRGGGK